MLVSFCWKCCRGRLLPAAAFLICYPEYRTVAPPGDGFMIFQFAPKFRTVFLADPWIEAHSGCDTTPNQQFSGMF
jgi:hypothetical protein